MKYSDQDIEKIIDYYINQVFKNIYLFEEENPEGYKHVQKVLEELEELPSLSPLINIDKVGIIELKLRKLTKYMLNIEEDNHKQVRNIIFESCNLLEQLKEGVIRGDA